MKTKSIIAVVFAISLLNILACKRTDDRNAIVYNMLKSEAQPGDTIKDLKINWNWKNRVVNTDLYNFDIEALNKRISLTIDSINNHTAPNVETTLWHILADNNINSMFDIFKCWGMHEKYHWACRPIHNAFGYNGEYRINRQSLTHDLLVVFSLDSTNISVHMPMILDDDYDIFYVGEKIGDYIDIYRNIDLLLNVADSLDAIKNKMREDV
jgi:hypothetical protein